MSNIPLFFQTPDKEEANNHKTSSWLEQIRGREDEVDEHPPQKMAVEMSVSKLMALQSLQNSLHLISMGMQHKNPLERLRDLQQQQQQQQQQVWVDQCFMSDDSKNMVVSNQISP